MRDSHRVSMGLDGEDLARVELHVSGSGAGFFKPVAPGALGRLTPHQAEDVAALQHLALQMEELENHLDAHVLEARSSGVSWAIIGWSTGLTAEGARQRWGFR